MKAMLDLNVVLDLLLAREPWARQSRPLLEFVDAGTLEAFIAASSIDTLYYIARKLVGAERARQTVARCLEVFRIAAVDEAVIRIAVRSSGNDLEDSIVIAAAVAAGCEMIASRDASGFEHSPIPVHTPEELVEVIRTR